MLFVGSILSAAYIAFLLIISEVTVSIILNALVVADYRRFEARLQMLQEQMMELNTGSLKTTQKRTLFVK